jgi:L-threonylcarbamoyladenylate synthase
MTRKLLAKLDFPLAAPSANPFGYISPTSADHVLNQLGDEVDYVLDGGSCDVGIESTIIAFENDEPIILRLGGLALEQIEEVLGEKVKQIKTSSSNPNAPGMLSSHYAPRKKMIVGDIRKHLSNYSGQEVAVIQLQKEIYAHDGKLLMYELSSKGDLEEAARRIFDIMRAADQSSASVILAEYMPDSFLGRAINDRLRRAENID